MVRELLVIQMCHGQGPLRSDAFKRLVRGVFLRPIEKDSKLLSELSLAYKTVCDFGKDPAKYKFFERVPKVFPGLSTEYEAILAAYKACAQRSPYTSNASAKAAAKGRARPGKRTHRSPSPTAEDSVAETHVQEVPVKKIFIDFENWPKAKLAYPKSSVDDLVCLTGGSLHQQTEVQFVTTPCAWCEEVDKNTQMCFKTGWPLCTTCMYLLNVSDRAQTSNMEAIEGGPGGRPRFYDHTQLPTYDSLSGVRLQTEIRVVALGSIEAARLACRAKKNQRICLLVHGRERGPTVEQKYRQSKEVCDMSSLQQSFPQEENRPVPPKGGIFVRDVCLRDEEGSFDPRLRVSMVYAAAAKMPALEDREAEQGHLEQMQEKVRNVLRIMQMEFQEELILGAWGCGQFLQVSPRRMAQIFGQELRENPEFVGYFPKVTFAVKPEDPKNPEASAVFRDFKAEFPAQFD